MSDSGRQVDRSSSDTTSARWCPPWCVTRHGVADGEEDWVHLGEPLVVSAEIVAWLCTSVVPETGEADGPYVVIGLSELSLSAAESLGESLIAMARLGAEFTPPSAGGKRSHDR